jgi:hypothetical protein
MVVQDHLLQVAVEVVDTMAVVEAVVPTPTLEVVEVEDPVMETPHMSLLTIMQLVIVVVV